MNSAFKVLSLAALALVLPACSTLQSAFSSSDPNAPVTYGTDAASNLKLGDEALENKNFIEAEKYFDYVRSKYPYLEAAKTAELRLADTEFDKESYDTARDKYESFVKLHPEHPRVDYAAYRAALTHYKQIPNDLFILPPAFEKDQTEVHGAVKAMNDFIKLYPKSKYVPEAQKVIADARKQLAEHELYVADFYAHRKHWSAVVHRLQNVVNNFSGLGFEERALFGLYDAYTQLHDDAKAKEALRTIVAKLPGTPAAQKAQKLLGS